MGRSPRFGFPASPTSTGTCGILTRQQAYIEIDETGTKAAAATAVIGVATAALNNNATLTVDRPFFAIIRDDPTGTVLFVARVLDP
jgi:serpin B